MFRKLIPETSDLDYVVFDFQQQKKTSLLSTIVVNYLPKGIIDLSNKIILGSGAFGIVSKCQWLRRAVAIKEIDTYKVKRNFNLTDQEVLEILQWEISCLSAINHPNLVQFYGIYLHKDTIYLVMEFCQYGNLQEALQNEPDLACNIRWQIAFNIANGLTYLHQQGILHRDLKAQNVLLGKHYHAKLADLGISQIDPLLFNKCDDPVMPMQMVIDRRFMAPEIINGTTSSTKYTDIYALGLVFWQLMVNGQNPNRLSKKDLCNTEPWLPETIPQNCPIHFKNIILKCWRLEPTDRPNAAQVAEQLYSIAADFKHVMPCLIKLCEELDLEINPFRQELIKYVPPYLTIYKILEEEGDLYWQHLENSIYNEFFDKTPEELDLHLATFNTQILTWTKVIKRFLKTTKNSTLLLLGDSGLGKTLSIYQLADELLAQWWQYFQLKQEELTPYYPILVRSKVSNWLQNGLDHVIEKVFQHYDLEKQSIQNIRWLIIIDGYDECQITSKSINLPNLIGLNNLPNAKLLVTCSSNVVNDLDLSKHFAFDGNLDLQYFLPFNIVQTLNYLKCHLDLEVDQYKHYCSILQQNKELRSVLRNPLVLSLLIKSWDTSSNQDLVKLNRWQVYKKFINHWINTKKRLLSSNVQQILMTNSSSLLESFNKVASIIAFNIFQQKKSGSMAIRDLHLPDPSVTNWTILDLLVIEEGRKEFSTKRQQLISKDHITLMKEEDYLK